MNCLKLGTLVVILSLVISCSNDSGFAGKSGKQSQAIHGEADADALPENPDIGSVVSPEIVVENTLVDPRNPLEAVDSILLTYEAVQELNQEFSFSLDNQRVETNFALTNIYSDRVDSFRQLNRTPSSQNFQQGTPGETIRDMFNQSDKAGMIDILIVMDDSGSMAEEQKNMSDKMEELLSFLSNTNWQIGVITTTPNQVCNLNLIDYRDPNANSRFRAAVQPGTKGSGNEAGILQSVVGLRCTENPWIRPDSTVALLIVSDEDNCSRNGQDCGNSPWNHESFLINYVTNDMKRVIGKDISFYGIFSSPDRRCNTALNHGVQYKRLLQHQNGDRWEELWGDICDASYAPTLRRISENIASLIRSQFQLTRLPDAGSSILIEIELANGQRSPANPNHYTINGRTLTFADEHAPPIGSKIHATYTVGATAMFDRVTLNSDPAPDTVQVMINSQNLAANAFTLNGREIRFNQQPAANAQIQVNYRLNQNLLTAFSISGTPFNNQITVRVDGTQVNNFSYDATSRNLIFDQPPGDNLPITAAYSNFDGPRLSYELILSNNNPRNFAIFHNDQSLNFSRNGNVFTINAADHEEARTLVLRYVIDDTSEKTFQLPQMPIDNTLTVMSLDMPCELGNGFTLVDDSIVSSCVVQDKTDFHVSYMYLASLQRFPITGVRDSSRAQFEVLINGVKTNAFSYEDGELVLAEAPAIGDRVDIYITIAE